MSEPSDRSETADGIRLSGTGCLYLSGTGRFVIGSDGVVRVEIVERELAFASIRTDAEQLAEEMGGVVEHVADRRGYIVVEPDGDREV